VRGVGHRTEGVGEVLDDEAAAVPEEGEDVVSDLEGGEADDVLLAEADELLALAAVDRLVAGAGGEALARFHLADDERASAADDEIDFAALRAGVAVDDAVAAEAVEPGSTAFAAASELARIDPTVRFNADGSASRCRCA
jgi:hypothetical protein